MKKRKLLSLFAAMTAGSVLLLNGCGIDLTSVNTEDTTISAEMETENLSDGTIQVHSVWYDADGNSLSSAEITLSDGDTVLFEGTTDDSGSLEACTLPGNTTITCEVTDSTGETLASASVVFKLSSDYEDLTIYTLSDEEDSQCVLEIPTEKTDIRAAIFVTEDGRIAFSNLTPYTESDETADEESSSDGEDTAEEDAADGESADSSESGEDTADESSESSGDTAEDGSADAGDTSAEDGTDTGDTAAE
ncbi:MAG: hypothetical protein LUF32_08540 [Clostridiales bacterium]|nr:hypothetical protein [Clostridiales bacterium]